MEKEINMYSIIDLETTGGGFNKERIIEIGIIITDGKKDSENGDTVKLDNSLWTKDDSYDADGTDSEGYSQYTNVSGDNLVKLLIEQDNVDFNN